MKIGAISIKVFFNKPNTLKIYFLGTKEFLYELRVRVSHALQIKEKKVKKVKSISRLHYYGDDARKSVFGYIRKQKVYICLGNIFVLKIILKRENNNGI